MFLPGLCPPSVSRSSWDSPREHAVGALETLLSRMAQRVPTLCPLNLGLATELSKQTWLVDMVTLKLSLFSYLSSLEGNQIVFYHHGIFKNYSLFIYSWTEDPAPTQYLIGARQTLCH